MPTPNFQLDFLDHVAIRVKDMEASIEWYKRVLGLRRMQLPAWGDYPIFMLSGQVGVAIFPAKLDDPAVPTGTLNTRIDHFAFRVSNTAFATARSHFEALGIPYVFKNHTYFHSVYLNDPDGHVVELTTLVVEPFGPFSAMG